MMKKLLIASTMLVSVAGFAAAEVKVSGSGRMGIVNDGYDSQFSSRVRINFDGSGTTDGGLAFGGSIRADNAGGGAGGTDGSVFLSGAFGKLSMGDTGNAADSLVGQVSGVGYIGNNDLNEIGWLDKANTGVQYEYTSGAITFAAGSGQLETNDFSSAAVKYTSGDYSIAVGYENNDDESQLSALVSATVSGLTLKAKIAKAESDTIDYKTEYALSVGYTVDGISLTAFTADAYDDRDPYACVDWVQSTRSGVGASYDLGGGATVAGGIAKDDYEENARYDLGVNFSF